MSVKAPRISSTETAPASFPSKSVIDSELDQKVSKSVERISENVHICANEPSLAFYRLAEHVRKALPPTVESKRQVVNLQQHLQRAYLDAESGLEVVNSMGVASSRLQNVQELLKNAIFIQQQIKYEQSRRPRREPSMYQRFSAHLNSVDLPDLSELRETASRVVTESVQKGTSRTTSVEESAESSRKETKKQ